MSSPHTPTPSRISRSVVAATLIGNFTEWFDFAVYGAVAVTLGRVFFPATDPVAALLASLGVFGVAYLFRPFGGALFGSLGDRHGRRVALSAAVIGISMATTLIALLPPYAAIGFWAPLLLVLLRAVQGLSAGGEWTSASAFLAEYAPDGGILNSLMTVRYVAGSEKRHCVGIEIGRASCRERVCLAV